MTTYSERDFERIAAAIGRTRDELLPYGNQFEATAMWFRLDSRAPHRVPPSKMHRKLAQISKAARRLLQHLGIDDPAEAADEPGDQSIFDVLASVDRIAEDRVASATARLGRMVAILEGIEVALELDRLAREASEDVEHIGRLTVAKGHRGDTAVNNWAAGMLVIYEAITGSKPATSVGSWAQSNQGIAGGPLIRFLQAAGAPLEIRYDEDAWRSRVRTILGTSS